MSRSFCALCALVLATTSPSALRAQSTDPGQPRAASENSQPSPWRPLRIAKWTAVIASAGAATYGFVTNARADHRFSDLERTCQNDPVRCRDRLPDGRYRDAELESAYQEVVDLDRRSRTALIAGQIGIAASVVLFLLDLGNERRPPDIPYNPRLDIAPARSGGVELRLSLPND